MNDKEIALHLLKCSLKRFESNDVYLTEDGIKMTYKEFYDFIKNIDKGDNEDRANCLGYRQAIGDIYEKVKEGKYE